MRFGDENRDFLYSTDWTFLGGENEWWGESEPKIAD